MRTILYSILIALLAVSLSSCGISGMRLTSDERVHWNFGYTDKYEGMSQDRDMPYAPYNHRSW